MLKRQAAGISTSAFDVNLPPPPNSYERPMVPDQAGSPSAPASPARSMGNGSLDPHTLGSYKKLSDTFGTTRDRMGNAVASAVLPTTDAVRRGQLSAQSAGGGASMSNTLGTTTDRFGNVIAAPTMPAFFKEGGEAVSSGTYISDYLQQEQEKTDSADIDPLGTAQKYLTDLTGATKKLSPVRQSIKRPSRVAGGAESSKEMNLKLSPLAETKKMVLDTTSSPGEPKNTDSARAQMEAFVEQYKRKIEIAKNKARGLRANTLGAPTLEAPTLTRNTLAKKTFAKGGMVKALKGTKAVDEKGSPVMAYRGEYGPSDKLSTELGSYSFGTKDAANLYATEPNNFSNAAEAMKVFPAQLSIRKPVVNAPGDSYIDLPALRKALGKKEFDRVVRKNAGSIEDTQAFVDLADAKGYTSVLDLMKKNPKDLDNLYTQLYPILDDPRSVKALQRRGYDGAIYGGSGATGGEAEYRVFNASQAISPYGNKPMAPRSARQQMGDLLQSMEVSPTDALGFFGKAAGMAGTALTPSTLNEGEDAELARRRSMPATVDRAEGSPEEGEVSQEELDAASRPAFVTPKSGKGRKSSAKTGDLETAALQGVSETPYNLLGAPVDLATMAMRPFGYNVEAPMLGSEDLKRRATKAGIRQAPPEEGTAARALYNMAEIGSSAVNPTAPVRAGMRAAKAIGDKATDVGKDFLEYNRQISVPGASYATAPKTGKPTTPLFSPLPSAQAPFVGRLDKFVAELPGAVQKDQFLGMLKGKFRDHEIGRAQEALEDLEGGAKITPSDLLNRIKQDYDPARYRTQIVEPQDGAFYSTMDNPYQGRPMGVIHLIQDAEPLRAAKEASAIDTLDALVNATYGTMGRSNEELINQYNNIKQALEGARAPNLSAVKRAFVPYAKAARARLEFSELQDTLVYPGMSDSYKSYIAEAQKTYGNAVPKEVNRQLEDRVMLETAEKMATKYGMQELVAQIPDLAKNRHFRKDFSPLYDGTVAENVEAMISATNATLRNTLRDRSTELRQSLNDATPARADSYRGQHSSLKNDLNPISFSRFTEHTTDIPGMGQAKGIYVHELQSDRLDDIRKFGPLGGSGKKDYETRLMPLELEHANLLKEYMELRAKYPGSPALAEKKKTLASLDKKRNAMLERVMSGKYALKESFPGMEDSPQVIQQLMAKNAVAGAIERGANFVAFPGAESAQAQLYEKLPNNLKQVVKDLGPGFEYRSVTLQSSNGTPIMHPAIVWGPEGVAKTKKEGIPFKKGGLVDKNTAFIKAHS